MLKKRVINYVQGDVIAKILSLSALLFIGAFTSKEEIAILNIIIFVAELAAVFITFGADSAFVKFYRDNSPKEVFGIYIYQITINFGIVSVVLYFIGKLIKDGIYQYYSEYYLTILLLSIFLSISNITRAHLVSLHESVKVKWYSIIGGTINLATTLLLMAFVGLNAVEIIASRIFSLIIYGALFIFMIATLFEYKKINYDLLKKMYQFTIPLMLSSLVGTLGTYMSRIVAGNNLNSYELGVFSFYIMLLTSASILLHSFNQAWYPHLFDLQNKGGDELVIQEINTKIYNVIKPIFYYFTITSALYYLGEHLEISLNGYYIYRYVAFILMDSLVIGVFYIIINPLIYIKSKTKYVTYASIILLLINYSISGQLVNNFGIFGAALSVQIMSVISFAVYIIFTRKLINLPVVNRINTYYILIAMVIMSIKNFIIYKTIGL